MLLLHIRFGKSVNLNENLVNEPHSLITGYKLCALCAGTQSKFNNLKMYNRHCFSFTSIHKHANVTEWKCMQHAKKGTSSPGYANAYYFC